MSEGDLASSLRRFPRVLGDLLVAPSRALADIGAAERGGFSVLLIWCLVAAVGLRFTDLVDAVIGFEAGGGLRVVSVLVGELTQAVPIALGAALAIVILAGAKRDPSVDLELGCAAAIPVLVVRAAFRAGVIVLNYEPSTLTVQGSYAVGGVWTLGVVALAIRSARRRPSPRGPGPTPAQRLRSQGVGWAAIGVLILGLAGSALWTVRHPGALGPVTRGAPAPDFTLPRVDGQPGTLALSSLRGRVVVLDFWATWCPPCLASLPMMHALSREWEPQGVTFVGVDSDGPQTTPGEVTAFLATHGAPYPVVYDDGAVNERYRIKVLPTLVIVGKNGAVDRVLIGITSRDTLAGAIEVARTR